MCRTLRTLSCGHARRHREVYLLLRPVSTFSFRNFSATLRLGVAPAPRSRIRHPGKLGLLLLELLLSILLLPPELLRQRLHLKLESLGELELLDSTIVGLEA